MLLLFPNTPDDRAHYPGAAFLVILHQAEPVGRLYLHETAGEIRLMDISVSPAWRSRGIGGSLTVLLAAYADARGVPLSLHVEPFNRVRSYYERLGFATLEERGIYLFLRRPPGGGLS